MEQNKPLRQNFPTGIKKHAADSQIHENKVTETKKTDGVYIYLKHSSAKN